MRLIFAAAAAAALFVAGFVALSPPLHAQSQDVIGAALIELESIYGTGVNGSASRINATSGNVAAATATATLTGAATKTTYIAGWDVDGGGATGAAVVDCTVTGLAGGTEHRTFPVPAGATLGATPLRVRYPAPLPASAVNTNIVASCPSFGTGNTNATVNAFGFLN